MKRMILFFISVALLVSIPLVLSTSAYCQAHHEYILKWGSQGSGDSQFQRPIGIGTDSEGKVYVCDPWNHRIQKFTSEGLLIGWWGKDNTGFIGWHDPGSGVLPVSGNQDGAFKIPADIDFDSGGNFYVVDQFNHRIQKFNSTGTFLIKWGRSGSADGQFNYPQGLSIDSSDNIYVTDAHGNRIHKFTSNGALIGWWGKDNTGYTGWHDPGSGVLPVYGNGNGEFDVPRYIAIDSRDDVYVVDSINNRIQKFTCNGVFLMQWGSFGSGDVQFDLPIGIDTDSGDNVYVAELYNHRIHKFTSNGALIGWWGKDNTGYTGWHGPGSGVHGISGIGDGEFYKPHHLVVDADDYVFVTDTDNYRIQKFGPAYITVDIDIKPGSDPNSINLGSNGNVPVAIFSTADFDATTVDPLTITLAGAEVRIKGKGDSMRFYEDVNGDGILDILVHVDTQALELSSGDTEAVLEGYTFDGRMIRGSDTVRIVQE